MRDKVTRALEEAATEFLQPGESIVQLVTATIEIIAADEGRARAAVAKVRAFTSPRAAVRLERYAVVTDRQIICFDKGAAGRVGKLLSRLERADIADVEYRRSVVSTVTVRPTGDRTGLRLTFGLALRKQADTLADVLGVHA